MAVLITVCAGSVASCLQVLAANEAVFVAVADRFASLTAAVLPAYRVRLRKVGSSWHVPPPADSGQAAAHALQRCCFGAPQHNGSAACLLAACRWAQPSTRVCS